MVREKGPTQDGTPRKRSKKEESSAVTPRRRRGRTLRMALVGVGCVLGLDSLVGGKGLLAMIEARQQYGRLEESLAAPRAENARLREEARRLREDPDAIEEIARRELA